MDELLAYVRRVHGGVDRRPGAAAVPSGLPVHPSGAHAPDGAAQARKQEPRHPPDLVILDLGRSDLDSVEVFRQLRQWTQAPIIVLSGRAGNAGATEPVPGRRAGSDGGTARVRFGGVIVDLAAKRVIRPRRDADTAGPAADIRLTPTEWHLL